MLTRLHCILAPLLVAVTCFAPTSALAIDPSQFDYTALQALMDGGAVDSIEGLLAALPATYRSHYVLVFSSRSLQQASLTDPRAILFGNDGHLLMSFNGDPAERGYEVLETIEYDSSNSQFRFREIRMTRTESGAAKLESSAVNPERCQRCHGTSPKPIWDSSPFWPGAYGERYGANLSAAERSGLALFLRHRQSHPRYLQLIDAERFAYHGTFVSEAKGEYDGVGSESPNAELSRLVGRMNIEVIATQLRDRANYADYRYAILGAAEGNCGAVSEFLPGSQRAAAQADLVRLTNARATAQTRENEAKSLRALLPSSGIQSFGLSTRPAVPIEVQLLAESGLGISTRAWRLSLVKDATDFTVSPEDGRTLAGVLRNDVARTDPKVRSLALLRDNTPEDLYCDYIPPVHLPPPWSIARSATLWVPLPPCRFPSLTYWQRAYGMAHTPHGNLLQEITSRVLRAAGVGSMPSDENWSPERRRALVQWLRELDSRAHD